MRFLHTGDWHLGKLFHNRHLTADQRFALGGLVTLAKDRACDAVVIAGDVFDRAVPPVEAVELLDGVLAELALEARIPVVMIAGNHDSPVRLEYLRGLVNRVGLHVVGAVPSDPDAVVIEGADGVSVAFWPLAYTDPETARQTLGRDDIHTHGAAIEAQVDAVRARMDGSVPNVLVAHAFVTSAIESESERPLTVGGTGEVAISLFDGFDYVALGHLHRPQGVGERIRYAGSLLKYSFDEADHVKSVTIVDVDAGGGTRIEQVPLPVLHDLARLRGTFAELLEADPDGRASEAFVEITLTGDEAVLDPMERLRAVYPNILSLRREYASGGPRASSASRRSLTRSVPDLFAQFYSDMTKTELTAEQRARFVEVADALDAQSREVAP